jgi:sortase B
MRPVHKKAVTTIEKKQNKQNKQNKHLLIYVLVGVGLFLLILLCIYRLKQDTKNYNIVQEAQNVMQNTHETHNTVETGVVDDASFFEQILSGDLVHTQRENDANFGGFIATDRLKMLQINNCIGYLQVDTTDIADWVVQSDDNKYYLEHDYNDAISTSGALFGDYRNNFEDLSVNNIIYGHNMADGSMFGTLQNLRNVAKDTKINIYLNTRCYSNIFEVYSVYEIDLKTFNYIQTNFEDTLAIQNFITETRKYNEVSEFDNIQIPENTKVLTLSTCTAGGKKRFVVHAYLKERSVF